jgi:hypothetical protein
MPEQMREAAGWLWEHAAVWVAMVVTLGHELMAPQREPWRRIAVNTALVGLTAWVALPVARHWGVPEELMVPVGYAVGAVGWVWISRAIRAAFARLVKRASP